MRPSFSNNLATRESRSTVRRRRGSTVTVSRKYQLQGKDDKLPIAGTGAGQWQIDIRTGIPLGLQEQRVLKVKQPNSIEVAQVAIRVQAMNPREIAVVRKQMSTQQQQQAAQLAKMPLNDLEARQIVTALQGNSVAKASVALITLMRRPLAKNLRDIIQSLRQLASKNNPAFRGQIKGLELSWKIELDGQR